ncbi:MAG: ABC transporter substrate-binding protein [Ruminococcaceae bacterium]|nr:ABC transporter substrate-binding protein [Oscillospiraceae bacterium]
MKKRTRRIAALLTLCLLLAACADRGAAESDESLSKLRAETGNYLSIVEAEPTTADPQCASDHYTVALNVFDRLVELNMDEDGASSYEPSLAESWKVTEEGYVYVFRLREGVRFSNGSPLTASDVRYSMERLITHPDSCHKDLLECIFGATALEKGRAQTLAGFILYDELNFAIVLAYPCASFLARLTTPAASILDEETTEAAGERFGTSPEDTIGTGPFIFTKWSAGTELRLAANRDCWSGKPLCDGLSIRIVTDDDLESVLFTDGALDILDLDNMNSETEYFIRGDVYQNRLYGTQRVGISYIALNENVAPLNDVRVRKALQLGLDRQTLLNVAYGGRGTVENGVLPRGMTGYDPELPEIPYDPEAACRLLKEAGLENGFELTLSVPEDSSTAKLELLELVAYMWEQLGVRVEIAKLDADNYNIRMKSGVLACYFARWTADYDDPERIFNTFFGSEENTHARSLCYKDAEVIGRVRTTCRLEDPEERLRAYHELERRIVQEDAAWIPLFSNQHYFVVSERVKGFRASWNGWADNRYCSVSVEG